MEKNTQKGNVKVDKLLLLISIILPLLIYNFKITEFINAYYAIYFLYLMIRKSDGTDPIFGALILVIVIPFVLILKKDELAVFAANAAYYLLVNGTILKILKIVRGKRNEKHFNLN